MSASAVQMWLCAAVRTLQNRVDAIESFDTLSPQCDVPSKLNMYVGKVEVLVKKLGDSLKQLSNDVKSLKAHDVESCSETTKPIIIRLFDHLDAIDPVTDTPTSADIDNKFFRHHSVVTQPDQRAPGHIAAFALMSTLGRGRAAKGRGKPHLRSVPMVLLVSCSRSCSPSATGSTTSETSS